MSDLGEPGLLYHVGVDSLPVHIAVLTIADDAATADRATAQAIRERATNAGHVIVEDEIAKDNEASIRDQLVRWIAEPNIDVVIVAASLDSEAASAALAPLVMQTLPGFTDLFRWLTFQEIGASAMLSAAEAAQCESTFVFVLPAHETAVRAAMDKLILPQLDLRTKPKNLVTQMPRLKDEAKRLLAAQTAQDAVPTPIATEKTVGGSGVMPKPPARPRTTSNTIARKQLDPPTKPIDLANLEKQIALSNANEANTKQIQLDVHHAETKVVDMSAHQAKTRVVDMSRLPRVPPGADEDAVDETDTLTFDTPPAGAYRSAAPIGVVKSTPLPSIPKPGAPSESKPTPLAKPPPSLSTPSFSTPIARTPPVRPVAATPPSPTPTPSSSDTATPPVAVPIIRPRSARGAASGSSPTRAESPEPTKPATATSEPKTAPPAETATPVASTEAKGSGPAQATAPSRAPTPPPTLSTPSEPAAAPARASAPTPPPTSSAPAPASPAPPSVDAVAGSAASSSTATSSSTPPASAATPSGAAKESATATPATRAAMETATPPPLPAVPATPARSSESSSATSSEPARRPSDSQIEEIAELPDDAIESAESATSLPASAPTPPAARPPTQPPAARPPTQLPPARTPTQPPPARPSTQPPPADPIAAVSARPLGDVDVPQGDFVYPIKKSSGGLVLKLLIAAAALAGGFFAFIKLYPQLASTRTEQVAQTPTPAIEPAPTPAPTEPVSDQTSEPVEPEIEIEPDEPGPSGTRRRRTDKPVTRPARSSKDATASKPAETESVASTEDKGKSESESSSQPAPASPDCDEVSCVMTKYDRPCCERYRPADSFRPSTHVPDELDKPMVKAGVETVKPRIIACGEKHGVKGTVRVSVSVADVGTVKSVSVVESPDPELGECVAAAMRKAKFGKSAKGGEFVYPFAF